ncbi:hypothetical protein HPB48_019800 [Haemaphysalis longicornis]|uniref:Fatty acyl-CoA reductase n=1 Tax=Haemaphysalis longicornis TaxID=44386 RepID=A0A9J6GDS6_HAELO|nr:hypothetical protein HPB48_019800 [Haemaphysalis longicornis]
MELRMASMEKPFISDFYKEKDIFITGVTGFYGQGVAEKLLRSCGGLRRIFVLMRAKGGLSPRERLDELLDTEALVHVSTAYCNCDKEEVAEVIYPPPFDPQNVIDAVSWMDDALVEAITPKLLGSRPNMYTFTKALAETLVAKRGAPCPWPSSGLPSSPPHGGSPFRYARVYDL